MIVVDANVVAYLILGGKRAPAARRALASDSDWAAPALWRSEVRNVLSLYVGRRELPLGEALLAFLDAESLVGENEYEVETSSVLSLAASSGCSAYDCEYVALATDLAVPFVTSDRALVKAFPSVAVSLETFVRR